MFAYYLDLALRSFRSARGLTALMVLTIAMGIGASMTTLTTFRALSGDPLPGRSANVLRVQLDTGTLATLTAPGAEPDDQLTRFDAEALMRERRATHQTMLASGSVGVEPASSTPGALKPFTAAARFATADFFPMFSTPFRYGHGWSADDDASSAPVVVLSAAFNARLFGSENSVGRDVTLGGAVYRVVGVLGDWQPVPYFFDLDKGRYRTTEDVFMPFSTSVAHKLGSNGNVSCFGNNQFSDMHALDAPCRWIQYWVELDTPEARSTYRDYLARYSELQHAAGRFDRPANARLHDVPEYLSVKRVVPEDVRLQVWLAFGFLAVCLVNTVGLLLAKCLRRAPEIGVRRALGAPKRQIFAQFLVEAGAIGLAGGVVGFAFAAAGVWVVRQGAASRSQWVHLDAMTLVTTFALAIGASLVAGLLPAWRACGVSPASQLKSS